MGVPVGELAVVLAVVDGDEPDARLDQPAGQQHALAHAWCGRSGRGASGPPRSRSNARRTAAERSRRKAFVGVDVAGRGAGFSSAARPSLGIASGGELAVERVQELGPMVEPVERDVAGQLELAEAEVGARWGRR